MKSAFFTLFGLLLICAPSRASESKNIMDSLPVTEPVINGPKIVTTLSRVFGRFVIEVGPYAVG
jgi:hypothetical protein